MSVGNLTQCTLRPLLAVFSLCVAGPLQSVVHRECGPSLSQCHRQILWKDTDGPAWPQPMADTAGCQLRLHLPSCLIQKHVIFQEAMKRRCIPRLAFSQERPWDLVLYMELVVELSARLHNGGRGWRHTPFCLPSLLRLPIRRICICWWSSSSHLGP